MSRLAKIAIFASGSGTNAETIIARYSKYPKYSRTAKIVLLLSDNPEAGAIGRAERLGVPVEVVPRADFRAGGARAIEVLNAYKVDFIVLAGFLSLVPPAIIEAFRGRIINVHPALLPAYGGKGMYGMRVHEAVIAAGERRSGITIHHVNEEYDSGDIIAQFPVAIKNDTPESLAAKIHRREHRHFPAAIKRAIEKIEKKR